MARTTKMKLLELVVLKENINQVLEYIGKKENFQIQTSHLPSSIDFDSDDDLRFYNQLDKIILDFNYQKVPEYIKTANLPSAENRKRTEEIIKTYDEINESIVNAAEELNKISETYKEAVAFSNLQVSYYELEHLSFISIKIGKIQPEKFDELKNGIGQKAVVVALGEDKSRVLIASSKRQTFITESDLRKYDFVETILPDDYKGIPESAIDGIKTNLEQAEKNLTNAQNEKLHFAETYREIINRLFASFAIVKEIEDLKTQLECTERFYRVQGWIAAKDVDNFIQEMNPALLSRIAIREYEPYEYPEVACGNVKVPVKITHGKFVQSFERMIFSYAVPAYGTVDVTPFVAIFFTLLFGFMFGDCGQGLFFILFGILMALKVIKVGGWNKFAPIFMAIGISSSLMGLLTGEFFGTETILKPFAYWITGIFGNPHAPILKLMPSEDPKSILVMFGVFGAAVAVGFIINSVGLIINLVNNFRSKKYASALFGKNGLAGAVFFWYVIALVLKIALLKKSIAVYDIVIISIALFFAAFAEPFERKMNGEKGLFENGFGTYLISGIVELIEVFSGYLSNTVSFVRVGAFALSHAVLNFTILTLTELVGGQGTLVGILVLIAGNALIIVLEGMIVAIQVIRLQYYEFFSKFFNESGREFCPFKFKL